MRYASPDIKRGGFLADNHQEYDITSFNLDRIERRNRSCLEFDKNFYLHIDFDIWKLLIKSLHEQIVMLWLLIFMCVQRGYL